jgi:hypothetical protein
LARWACSSSPQARGDRAGDEVGVQLALRGQQPAALLVLLADDPRGVRGAVERVLHVELEEGELVLDDEDLLDALGQLADGGGLERPDHADLQDAHAGRAQRVRVEPEVGERLQEVVVGLAGGHDPEPGAGGVVGDAVQAVLPRVGPRELQPHLEEVALGDEGVRREHRRVGLVDVGAPRAQDLRHDRDDPVGRDLGGGGGVGHVRDDLQARPQPARARQRDRVAAEVQDLLDRARPQRRQHERGEHGLRRARQRGGLAARVVAHERDGAARARRAAEVRVADRVRRPVQAGVLAVPPADHAVHAGAGEGVRELGAPHGRGPELLVDRGLQVDLVRLAEGPVALELLVQPAERGALVARRREW